MNEAPASPLSAWLHRLEALGPTRIELGLDRVRTVAEKLDLLSPSASVLTIAGTNGKGSTVALAESIALAAGLRVASYTSPHILRFNERVRVNGAEATDDELAAGLDAVEAARGDVALTYFEFVTLAALWHFRQCSLDLWILEIGLGGRLDVVNVIDPQVSVITSIGLDHQDWLGDSRDAIAMEKAGILRAGRPVVIGELHPPEALQDRLEAHDGPVICAGTPSLQWSDETEGRWRLTSRDRTWSALPEPGIRGDCAKHNAAVAVAALQLLQPDLPEHAVRDGLREARIVGRFQRIATQPITIVDTAHNPQAAGVLARSLNRDADYGPLHCVLSMLADKDAAATVETFMQELAAESSVLWYYADSTGPRGLSGTGLQAKTRQPGQTYSSVPMALDAARKAARPGERVVCFGSFLTVESALRHVHD